MKSFLSSFSTILILVLLCAFCLPNLAFASEFKDMADMLNAAANLIEALDDDDDAEAPDASQELTGPMVKVKLAGKKVSIHQSLKDSLDDYEAFFDEYIAFMNTPDPDMNQYARFMQKYTDYMIALDSIGDYDLSDAELAYYLEVSNRINQKLILLDE